MIRNKILVTGGFGYIGSHTVIELIEKTDFEIISLDNFLNSSLETAERIESVCGKSALNYSVDLCDRRELQAFMEKEGSGIRGVIHFAALKSVPDSVADPVFYYRNNLNGLLNLLECCEEFGIEHFIFSSSCSVYGNVKKEDLPVSEDTPIGETVSPYAHTKKVGERIIRDFAEISKKVRVISLRYFNPVGAHESGKLGEDPVNPPTNLLPLITQTAVGLREKLLVFGDNYETRDGSCIRDYIHVSDIADAHIRALNYLIENKNVRLDVFNLGSGKGVTVLEAVRAFEEISGQKLNYEITERRKGDVEAIYSDSSKAEKLLLWRPERDLHTMLRSALKWQKYLSAEKA